MSKLIKTTFFALLAAGLLLAFRGPDQRRPPHPQQRQEIPRIQDPAPDTSGTIVAIDSAQACIDRYEKLMSSYGFSRRGGERVNIKIRRSRMITTGEIFSGKKMFEWLKDNVEMYDDHKRTLKVRVAFGVYDEQYLRTYHPRKADSALRVKYMDRIAVFLLPVDSVSGVSGMPATARIQRTGGVGIGGFRTEDGDAAGNVGGGGGGKGFDLGGIQP